MKKSIFLRLLIYIVLVILFIIIAFIELKFNIKLTKQNFKYNKYWFLHQQIMADTYQKVLQVKFYECGATFYSVGVMKYSDYNKYYLSLSRNTVYIDMTGCSK